jgi:hypothetical protein
MSRIVSPIPFLFTIEVNEVTGAVSFKRNRDIGFPQLMAIFAQVQLEICKEIFTQMAATAAPGVVVPPNTNVKGN